MIKIIASTYEIIGEIGSGKGGIVFLANHKRLSKKVILKADQRKITTKEELLRREVDTLKNLSNPYVPQVYDYFMEDSTVYTVMEYIEGESLDKPLKEGRHFEQTQIIKWAIQLLSALNYLHSPVHGNPPRGYIHSDIKPANIMCKPNGDICLIDFNIAFALNEEYAIGGTSGYASPEHYGLDFSSSGSSSIDNDETDILNEDETETLIPDLSSKKKKVTLDVRSDIYAVGATLYHLLSGKRPAKNALDVVPLSKNKYSPMVVDIIAKAMNPNPELRYQTALEMLDAIIHLRENDFRFKHLKKQKKVACCLILSLLTLGIFSGFAGLRRIQLKESWLKLAEYSHDTFNKGDSKLAIQYIMQVFPSKKQLFAPKTPPKVQEVLTEVLGVYDLADDFNIYKAIQLPSAPLNLEISSDAATAACVYEGYVAIVNLDSGEIIETFSAEKSALAEVKYIDENKIVYAASDGITAYDISEKKEIWKGDKATAITISGDGGTIAAVYKDNTYATIYDAYTGNIKYTADFRGRYQNIVRNDSFANPYDNLLKLNYDGTKLAVSFSDGSLSVLNLNIGTENEDIEIFADTSNYNHFEGGFHQQYLAVAATDNDSENSIFAIIDTDSVTQTGGFQSEGYYFTHADEEKIIVGVDNILVQIDPLTGEQQPLVDTAQRIDQYSHDGTFTVTSTNGHIYFFNPDTKEISSFERDVNCNFLKLQNDKALIGSSDSPIIWITKYENHSEAEIAVYDGEYKHDEARLSADSKTIMLFSYDRFRVCNTRGDVIQDVSIPDAEEVYDQQFIRDGINSYLEVTYNDGKVLKYDASNGQLIGTEIVEKPDLSMYEEFETNRLRIESPLHGTPKVYDRESGKFITELNADAYLTYISEINNYIVAQYVTTDNKYYGCLMNQECQILAYLPNLCDVFGDKLLFDYPTGHIREAKLYELDDLKEIAQNELKEGN